MKINYDAYCMVQLARLYYERHPERLTVLHVGGYDGTWDVHLTENLEGIPTLVYSLEPHPANYELMRSTFRGHSNLHALNYAVSATPGPCSLYGREDEKNQSSSFIKGFVKGGGRVPAESVTLANLYRTLGLREVHLLRLNCEGSEFSILDGKGDLSFLKHTAIINLCLHGKIPSLITKEMNQRKREITELIQSFGFRLVRGLSPEFLSVVRDHAWQVYIQREVGV